MTLNICLKDKNEIAKYKSRGLTNAPTQGDKDEKKIKQLLDEVANQPLSAVQKIAKYYDRCSDNGLNPKFEKIPNIHLLSVTEYMFNIHVLASQLVFNQSSSPTLESSMTAYLTLISSVASEVQKGEHSNDLKMNQLIKTVPKKFLSVDPTSNVGRMAHLNGFVVMLRKMDPVFKARVRSNYGLTWNKFQESVLLLYLVVLHVGNNIPKVYQNRITTKGPNV